MHYMTRFTSKKLCSHKSVYGSSKLGVTTHLKVIHLPRDYCEQYKRLEHRPPLHTVAGAFCCVPVPTLADDNIFLFVLDRCETYS
jgi:hypothetical protein